MANDFSTTVISHCQPLLVKMTTQAHSWKLSPEMVNLTHVIRWWSLEEEIKWKKYDICHVDFFLNFLDAFLLHESLNQMSYLFNAHQTGCWRRRWRIWQSPIRTPPDLDSWGSRANKFTRNRTRTDVPRKERDRSFKGILIFFLEIFSPREWYLPICILCCSSVFPMLAIVKSAT